MKNDLEKDEVSEMAETNNGAAPTEEKKEFKIKVNIKTMRTVAVVVVVLLLAYFLKSCLIAATVNGSPISRIAVIQQLEKMSGKAALDNLITQKLIASAAKKQGVVVSAEEIAIEMKKIEDQLASSGQPITLDVLLEQRKMTRGDLEKQIVIQKDVEKLLGEKAVVTDDDVEKYITENKITLPEDEELKGRQQIKDALLQQKITQEGQILVDALRTGAKINYFVQY